MGPMLLHWLMMAVVDGFVHGNAFAGIVAHWLIAKVMTIVSTNFDSTPNGVLDSMLNAYNLYN